MQQELLTTREVADLLRVSVASVARWVRDGHLLAMRLPGGSLRFRREDVDAFLLPDEPAEATA